MFTSYCEAVKYLLETYGLCDVITKIDAEIKYYRQASNKLPREYAKAVLSKSLRCDIIYDEYVLKGIFLLRDYQIPSNKVCIHGVVQERRYKVTT